MGRIKVNPTLDAALVGTARHLGLNLSRRAEGAIAEAAKQERNRVWREEHRVAIAAHEAGIDREGLPLARFRSV